MRYAATDILSTLSAPVGELDEMELQREAKLDLVALMKSLWAIRFGKVAQLTPLKLQTPGDVQQHFVVQARVDAGT